MPFRMTMNVKNFRYVLYHRVNLRDLLTGGHVDEEGFLA